MNNITIAFCEEDRQRLDLLTSTLIALGIELKETTKAFTLTPVAAPAAAAEHPADAPTTHLEPPAAEPVVAPAPEVKIVSLAEFQKAVTQTVAKGATQKKAAREIINKYAASVSAVPEDKRAEVMDALAQI